MKKTENKLLKLLIISGGMLCVGLGVLGMFLPVLPTTPFLLLAAFLFARSSDRLHAWLLGNRVFGKYLKNYLEKRSIPLGIKIYALSMLWLAIGAAVIFFVEFMPARILMLAVAAAVTVHIISLRTC